MSNREEAGFTLLEALVALLVLGMGFVGAGYMQLKALQSASVSYHRSIATHAAQDAVERLWSELADNAGTCPSPSAVYSDWYSEWSKKLPSLINDVSLIDNSSYACEYKLTIVWSDDRFSGESDVSTLVYKSRLPGDP